jgi:hypothetical protein
MAARGKGAARARCDGTTGKGQRCKRSVVDGSAYCRAHTPVDVDELPIGPVGRAVQRDLMVFRRLKPELLGDTLKATAMAMAKEIDEPDNSATSKATCARALAEMLEHLRSLLPEKKPDTSDGIDDLSKRRAARIARRPGA